MAVHRRADPGARLGPSPHRGPRSVQSRRGRQAAERLRQGNFDKRLGGPRRYMLTRFDGRGPAGPGDRPPIILIPGFSMSTYWFRARTPGINITEFLRNHGYDVWLLDYRASDRLKASREQFTLDDLATSDFPDAIQDVFDVTGRPAQIIAHCVGSLSVLMSLLSGNIHRGTVHSMILSQACAFIDQPFVNRLKQAAPGGGVAFLRVPPNPDGRLRSSIESGGSTARSAACTFIPAGSDARAASVAGSC